MALDPGSGRRSVSPESSGRDSPIPRQWRNQLGGEDAPGKDKVYRRYASGVDRVLSLFETALEEWADYISFLNKLLKALQARPSTITSIPSKTTVAKRLAQCLNPALPSGVHQKALEVYHYVFTVIGKDGLSRDLPLYLPGLAPTLSFASLSVRSPYLDLLEHHFLAVDPRSLRPAMRSIILALLPGLEEETSEDFDRTLRLVAGFKEAIRPPRSETLTEHHSSGDDYFWQCFFLASITSHSRRSGALAYLVRYLPVLEPKRSAEPAKSSDEDEGSLKKISLIITSPEPGLLVRCFASGLGDEQLLIQRGFLDLLVTHLPLNSDVLQTRVKSGDLEILFKAAAGVVTRRDMSLNRRLWAWLLGPDPTTAEDKAASESNPSHNHLSSKTSYFEEYGLQPLTRALLDLIKGTSHGSASERARPFRICLSLMDRWEIGGLIVPEVFLPVIESVRRFQNESSSKPEYTDVLRSASVFFDGIESGLIYGELVGLLAQAMGPGSLSLEARIDKLNLVNFILTNFNVREEEMITIHAPLACLAALSMLEDSKGRHSNAGLSGSLSEQVLDIATALLDLVPERTFRNDDVGPDNKNGLQPKLLPNLEVLKKIKDFYVNEQGNIEASPPPFNAMDFGLLLLQKAVNFICDDESPSSLGDWGIRVRILSLALLKTPTAYYLDIQRLLTFLHHQLAQQNHLPFPQFASIIQLSTQLYAAERIELTDLSALVPLLVRHAWSYLAASEPRYHVESVRCLWQLQTALSPANRDIEAAISTILVESGIGSVESSSAAVIGRTFGVLWSHTLQDNQSDRRGSKTPMFETRQTTRLSGTDNYEIMLSQPLFLVLDALVDDRSQLHMAVKSWLSSMVGIDRLLLVFVNKLSSLPFLKNTVNGGTGSLTKSEPLLLSEDDDLDLCLYYLRTLHHVLRYSGAVSWAVLASKHLLISDSEMQITSNGEDNEMPLQEFFVRICMRCITADLKPNASKELVDRTSQLCRFALITLHQFLLSQYAGSLSTFHFEEILLDRLQKSIDGPDPYIQILLLDVVFDCLRLKDVPPVELPTSPGFEKKQFITESVHTTRQSLTLSDARPTAAPPPPQLLKCLQAGLSSPNSRPVLENWISFFSECLPFYSDSVFQVLIPLVETLCKQVGTTFSNLRDTFLGKSQYMAEDAAIPESTLIHLLNGLEQVLARAHDQLLEEEARAQLMKGPDQPQSLFGSMVSGVFQADAPQSRSATANDRLTVHLAFQDAVRICFKIWSWGQGDDAKTQDPTSLASFSYTSLRMRNRARRLLEHLFTAETLECLETIIDAWRNSKSNADRSNVFKFLSSLDASRPRHTIPALFNAIYSRSNPGALEPSRKSTMTISLQDSDLVVFLVEYARSLDDDAMDEIWQDCMTFLKDLLSNPFPHRHTLPSLLEFAAILGDKVDNTNFGEQKRMRRELGDVFLRLLTALFTARPITFPDATTSNGPSEKVQKGDLSRRTTLAVSGDGPDDLVHILASIVPILSKILLEPDRVLSAANTISSNVIGPTVRSKSFPDTVTRSTMKLLHELTKLQNNQKTWKKDVGDAFNDPRFFGMDLALVKEDWLSLLRQWILADKEKMPEMIGRISAPTTAGIVFGVGATSARLEADRKTQLSLRRIATLILASAEDAFVSDLGVMTDKLVELLAATSTSSPSSTTRADVYLVMRALVLKTSAIHLAPLWPIVNAELHAAISSVVAPDHSAAFETFTNASILQACKLLDLLICVAPDDFQLHEWLFITDTIDAVYRSSTSQPVALVDELSEELGNASLHSAHQADSVAHMVASSSQRRPLLGAGGISDEVSIERRDELVAKVLRPFFAQLSIFAFESTYAMGALEWETCTQALLKDVFDERTIVRAL